MASKLQEVDSNFVRALDAATELLQHVRSFDKAMQDVADGAEVWCQFFDHVRDVSSGASAAGSADQLRARTAVKPSRRTMHAWRQTSDKESQEHNDSAASDLSSQNPPTPTLPVFSKSFAKTPMFRKMRVSSSASEDDEDDHNVNSRLKQDLDESLDFHDSEPLNFRTPLPERSHRSAGRSGAGSAHLLQDNILDLSEISAATPGTPVDGDYGPPSAVKSRQLLEYGTPARHVTNMLMGSSMRSGDADLNRSDASSNPATPVPLSPFMTDALLHSDEEEDAHDNEDQEEEGHHVEEEDQEQLLGSPGRPSESENVQFQMNAMSPPIMSKLGDSETKFSPAPTKMTEKKLAAITGTPISRSVAQRRRRSLMRYAAEAGEVDLLDLGGLQDEMGKSGKSKETAGYNSDEDLLGLGMDDGVGDDSPPPEFDLKLFPHLFQSGEGASQVTAVYSQFSSHEAFCLPELKKRLPNFGQARLELMLDMLVSRGFLRPFTVENHLYWRAPSADEF